jgi:hypothetical protein
VQRSLEHGSVLHLRRTGLHTPLRRGGCAQVQVMVVEAGKHFTTTGVELLLPRPPLQDSPDLDDAVTGDSDVGPAVAQAGPTNDEAL